MTPTLAVIAKAPVPGRSKTRLCTPQEAAALAEATPELLARGLRVLGEHSSALGLARDGGFGGIGLRAPHPGDFAAALAAIEPAVATRARPAA